MGLETGTTVNDLVSTNPVATDPRSEGDDHLRLVKVALKTCFPSLAGAVDRVQAKSAGYTVAVTDTQSLIHCTAALTLGSPAAATAGNGFGFAIYADGFDVVFDPNSTELVNGAATATVGAGSYAYVRCTGAAWLLETPAVSIHAATNKTTPIGADEIGYLDSVTSFGLVKMTFTNFWASLATRYMALVAPGTSGNVLTSNGSAWTSAASPATAFSSAAENIAGTIENKSVDPLGIREAFNATGSAPVYACRAWVNFNGAGTVAIRASGNVSSITDNGVGDYTINFTTAMPDANYSWSFSGSNVSNDTSQNSLVVITTTAYQLSSTLRINTKILTGGGAQANGDPAIVNISLFR